MPSVGEALHIADDMHNRTVILLINPSPSNLEFFPTPPSLTLYKGSLLPQSFNPLHMLALCINNVSPQQHDMNRFHYYVQLSDHRPLIKVLKKGASGYYSLVFSL